MRPETILQRAIRADLAKRGYRSVAVPNGAVLAGTPKKRAIQMASLKKDGLTVGFPDLIVFGPNCVGFIEVKHGDNDLSAKQVEVAEWLTAWGHLYAVCWSVEHVASALEGWGWKGLASEPEM